MTGWLALIINTIGLQLLRRKSAWGWLFGIIGELFWIASARDYGMTPLIWMSAIYIVSATETGIKWRNE